MDAAKNIDKDKYVRFARDAKNELTTVLEQWFAVADALNASIAELTISVRIEGWGEYRDTVRLSDVALFRNESEDEATTKEDGSHG